MNNFKFYETAALFSIFSDPTRLKIIFILLDGAKNVKSICQILDIKQSTCSHQLKILKQSEIVKSKRKGQHIFYFINNNYVKRIFDFGYQITNNFKSPIV